MTKFSQNKVLKIACISNVLSIAHKTMSVAQFKAYKSTSLQNIKSLFMTNVFFILRLQLKQLQKFISKK
jgi:hypothetical protein